ncbi:S-methyl-5'-thioadenosine phosphorylase [uncultured archaeon]|nr:S-methyl-5'-thioadenosine phosphorylase [uncultured archaeon]
MGKLKIGIIGGSGLENPELLENYQEKDVETPFGKPSSKLITGKLFGIDVVIIPRHGRKHEIPPTQINNRANIFALKYEGCKYILATTAVGSLREEIKREDFVIMDQFIDFTRHRDITFYEKFEFGPIHTPMADPFSEDLRKKFIESCEKLNFSYHKKGTVVTIEGPRFSTRAESSMYRQWGADIINMSTAPEATLANEAEVPYAAIAMATDYDCWKQDEDSVTGDIVVEVMKKNTERVKKVLLGVIESFSREEEVRKLKETIRTIPDFPKQGIMFRDITTLLKDREAVQKLIEIFYERYKDMEIDAIAGIESRGFALAGMLAGRLGTGLILIRKPGKLPAETISEAYNLEYGVDSVEIHKDAISPGQKILLIDDLIATGGTAEASCKLIEKLQGKIVECAFAIELPDLKGKEKLARYPIFSVMKFEGE